MNAGYKQFCPVAMASEIICTRWTIVLLREFVAGSTHFNDLRKGVPTMSPTLLSQRLKDLEAAGIIEKIVNKEHPTATEYHLTQSGRDLQPVVEAIGIWGQHWVEAEVTLENLDASLLMWDMRRSLDTMPTFQRRSTIEFLFNDLNLPKSQQHWWLIIDPESGVDLCSIDPGNEVDLFVSAKLRAMTSIWLGLSTVEEEQTKRDLTVSGDPKIASMMQTWLGLSPFAAEKKLV